MIGIISVFIVVLVSLLITRVASVALSLTGLSRESARFQARSALSGTGFTTDEAETVVNHPVRRRIIMGLMLVGSAGLITAVGALVISFGGSSDDRVLRAGVLLAGLLVLWLVSRSEAVDRWLSRIVERFLRARGFDVRDYASVLHLSGDYSIGEVFVQEGDWVAGRRLADVKLRAEGIEVLGVERVSGEYVGVPEGETVIDPGDTLILYARDKQIESIGERERARGEVEHEQRKAERERERLEEEHEPERERGDRGES